MTTDKKINELIYNFTVEIYKCAGKIRYSDSKENDMTLRILHMMMRGSVIDSIYKRHDNNNNNIAHGVGQ